MDNFDKFDEKQIEKMLEKVKESQDTVLKFIGNHIVDDFKDGLEAMALAKLNFEDLNMFLDITKHANDEMKKEKESENEVDQLAEWLKSQLPKSEE